MFRESLWAIVSAAMFSVMAAFVKAISGSFGPFELIFYRSLFGAVLIFFVISRTAGVTLKTAHLKDHFIRSSLGVASIALWFFALPRMDFGACMTLTYTTPIFMAAWFTGAALIAGKAPPWGVAAAILAGFSGILAVVQPAFAADEALPAMACILLSVVDLFVYAQMKRLGDLGEPSVRIVFYFTLFGMGLGLGGAFLLEGGMHMPSGPGALGLLGMGLAATLGQISVTRAYAKGNMRLSACLGYMAIPFSALIGFLVFGDRFGALPIAGMALITAAGLAATVITKRRG